MGLIPYINDFDIVVVFIPIIVIVHAEFLLPFFLMHALADMFGSSILYLLINWGS